MAGEGDLLPVSRVPGRRHVPDGHDEVREASDRQGDPHLGFDDLHRLREVRGRLSARDDPHEGVTSPTRRRACRTSFPSKAFRSKDIAGHRMTIQVAPDDCTGCGVCVDVCPAKAKTEVARTRRSTWSRTGARDGRARALGPVLARSRRSTAACCRTTRSRAHRRSSRCSSSPAPVLGAARRHTSSS